MSADVYVLKDKGGEILYIGRSCNVPARLATHRREKAGWPEVSTVDVIHLDNRPAQERCERELIALLRPPWNIMGVPAEVDTGCVHPEEFVSRVHFSVCCDCGEVFTEDCNDECGHQEAS